jgi:hypothetical protein
MHRCQAESHARRAGCLLLGALLLLPAAGCANVLAGAMYVLDGTNVDAEYKGLQGKRVAVVCRQLASEQYNDPNVTRDLAKLVGLKLSEHVRKIKIIDQQEVANWTDANQWEEFTEIGKALEADMVVAIDLEDFRLLQGQTLLQGRANVQLKVYDLKEADKLVFEKFPRQSLYPPNTGIPTSEKQLPQFRREYLNILADEIARYFYDHDSRAWFALDSTAF